MDDRPTTHYVKSDDVHVAYQVFGEGPLDLLFVPGGGHGAGGRYGQRKLMDFFVRNLLDEATPDWNVIKGPDLQAPSGR